ncbi:MAG: AAA family ATPase, partial [Synergistaceae bacterium]|nr:AAA family ATPase [Synergistaceae bacterium]
MKKRILTGAESFEEIIEGDYFYVDKTLFIKELLESKGKVTLITRPRRFGKTMNMSMLEHFFGLAAPSGTPVREEGKPLFDGLKIMEHGDIVEKHKNKYPVVFLTLKNVESVTYGSSVNKI